MTHLFYMVFEAQQKRVLKRTIHASRDLHGSANERCSFKVEPQVGLKGFPANYRVRPTRSKFM
jgi:hypothetical protein